LHDVLDEYAMVFGCTAKICPVAPLRDLKSVKVGSGFIINIFTELLDRFFLLFIPSVTEALQE